MDRSPCSLTWKMEQCKAFNELSSRSYNIVEPAGDDTHIGSLQ